MTQADINTRQSAEDARYRKRAVVALAIAEGRHYTYGTTYWEREAKRHRNDATYIAALHGQIDEAL